MKRVLQCLHTIGRHAGRRDERQRHEERDLGKFDQRQHVGAWRELAPGWHVGELGMAGGAAELHECAERALLPHVALDRS